MYIFSPVNLGVGPLICEDPSLAVFKFLRNLYEG